MLDENGEIILPGTFIPAAERYHLMPSIDRWVISHVFSMMSGRHEMSDLAFCAINLSGQSVGDEKILQFILDQFDQHQVDPSRICFEITETAAVANMELALKFMDRLHDIGCQFALDDFGSGLSSFAYLKNLNVDFLKIDGSFVRDIVDDPVDHAMVSSINQVGHLMGIRTIAEFVEDEKILALLKEIGVDFAQGYAIEKPLPIPVFDKKVVENEGTEVNRRELI
jgi:EAL domain-containing protein (putative c-di-GMP-specific phosphodiesterase class I)